MTSRNLLHAQIRKHYITSTCFFVVYLYGVNKVQIRENMCNQRVTHERLSSPLLTPDPPFLWPLLCAPSPSSARNAHKGRATSPFCAPRERYAPLPPPFAPVHARTGHANAGPHGARHPPFAPASPFTRERGAAQEGHAPLLPPPPFARKGAREGMPPFCPRSRANRTRGRGTARDKPP